MIGNAFSSIQSNEKVPTVSSEIPTVETTESVLSSPVQGVVSFEEEYIPSPEDSDRPADSHSRGPIDSTEEVSSVSVQSVISDDEFLPSEEVSSVQSVISEYEEPTLILNPEVFRIETPGESATASVQSVHAPEALEGSDSQLGDLLQLLNVINEKSQTLDADEQGVIDQVKSLIEKYKNVIA